MIYQLFGIPGSGKSYISSLYANKENCILYEKLLFSKKYNVAFKIYVHLGLGKILEKGLYCKILHFLGDQVKNKHRYNFGITPKKYVQQICYFKTIQRKYQNKHTSVVFDEGTLHHFVALIAEFGIKIENIEFILPSLLSGDETVYYVRTSIEKAYSRIKNRKRRYSKMDYLGDDALLDFLRSYLQVCNKVYEELDNVKVIEND